MRILFVTEEPIDFSGAMVRGGQIHVRNVVLGLRERGHDVHLVDWNDAPTEPFQHSISPRTRFVEGPMRTLRQVLAVGRLIEPDVIVSKTRKVYLPGLVAARRLGVPHVVHVGSSLTPASERLLHRADAASFAARVRAPHDAYFVVCEPQVAELVDRGIAPDLIYDVRNAADVSQFRPDPDIELPQSARERLASVDGPVLGFVGSLSENKGVLDLADAVSRTSVDPTVLVAGDGPARDTFEAALNGRGVFLDSVPYDQMPAVYAAMDVLVLPSHSEGLPRVLLEAGAAGVPVIATNVGGIPDVVREGETGLLCPPRDPAALAASIDSLFTDYDPRRLGADARDVIVGEYAWSRQYERYDRFLGDVVS